MRAKALFLGAALAAGEANELKLERHCDSAVGGVSPIVFGELQESEASDCRTQLRRSCLAVSKRLPQPKDSDARGISDHRFTLAELALTMLSQHRSLGDRCLPRLAGLDQDSRSACAEAAAYSAGFLPMDRYFLSAMVATGYADPFTLEQRLGEEDAKVLRGDVRRLQRMPSSVIERLRMMFARCPYSRPMEAPAPRQARIPKRASAA